MKVFTRSNFSTLIDVLHAAIASEYTGTPEQLADLVLEEGKAAEVGAVIVAAMGKAFPSTQPAPATAGDVAPNQIQ